MTSRKGLSRLLPCALLAFTAMVGLHPVKLSAQTLLLNIDFETSIPFSWSQSTADASSNGFQWGSSIGLSSEFFPIPVHSFFVATNDDKEGCWNGSLDSCSNKSEDRLIMPTIDMSVYPNLRLQADIFFIQGTYVYTESAAIQVSLDGGTSWTTLRELTGSPDWVTETVDLSAFAGQPSVTLCFHYNDGGGWLYGLGVDNVRIIEPVAYDASVTAINLTNPYELEGAKAISGTLVNLGGQTITNLTLNYRINTGDTVSQNISGLSIAPLANYPFVHDVLWNSTASPASQSVTLWASNLNDSLDQAPANDQLTQSIYIVSPDQTTDRMVVFEHFTSSNSSPSGSQNPAFVSAMQANSALATYLSYHVWWPFSTDPFYQAYSVGSQERVSYYNNVFAPWAWMDGQDAGGLSNVNSTLISNRADYPALFELSGGATINGSGELEATLNLTSLAPYWGSDVSVHLAVIEEYVPGPNPDPNGNSESEFRHVVRQMLPDAFGTAVTALGQGATQTITQIWTLPAAGLVNPEEIALVAFVQDNASKAVLQGSFFRAEVVGLEAPQITARFGLYPNPAAESSLLYLELDAPTSLRIELMDATGRVIRLLGDTDYSTGRHTLPIAVNDLSTGAYFVSLSNQEGRQFKQLQVIR
ncbi:MAG: Omp28-related outer membrane protein [Bacteroidetes bacterium]|nr:Omp28-related outer membrane protein [Bacteroidota bacterium]